MREKDYKVRTKRYEIQQFYIKKEATEKLESIENAKKEATAN